LAPLGNRVYKKSTDSGGSSERKYVVDPQVILAPQGVVDITGQLPVILLEINPSDSSLKKNMYQFFSSIPKLAGALDNSRGGKGRICRQQPSVLCVS
jgi:hypothetical protein